MFHFRDVILTHFEKMTSFILVYVNLLPFNQGAFDFGDVILTYASPSIKTSF
jgi:hypothetical protein